MRSVCFQVRLCGHGYWNFRAKNRNLSDVRVYWGHGLQARGGVSDLPPAFPARISSEINSGRDLSEVSPHAEGILRHEFFCSVNGSGGRAEPASRRRAQSCRGGW